MLFVKKLFKSLTVILILFTITIGYLLFYTLNAPNPPLEDLESAKDEFKEIMLTGYGYSNDHKHVVDIVYFTQTVPKYTDSDIWVRTPSPKNNILGRGNYLSLHGGPLYGLKGEKTEYYLFANEITQHYNPTWLSWGDTSKLLKTDWYLIERDIESTEMTVVSEWTTNSLASGYLTYEEDSNSVVVKVCGHENKEHIAPEGFSILETNSQNENFNCR